MNELADDAIGQPLIGHQAQIARVEESFASGKMHHAWLLTGPTGVGKSVFARHLAAAIIAHDDGQAGFFGDEAPFTMQISETNPAMRQVMQMAHPDYLYLAPIQDEKNKSGAIKVEQIRELVPFFSHKSATGGWRVAVIDNLDAVNVQGANAMLKIVEEPPEKAIIILIARSAGSVLPTIRSRCRELRFQSLTADEQLLLLQGFLPEADAEALRQLGLFSGGSMGYALEVAQTDALDLYEASCLILAKPQSDASQLLDISGKWGSARKKALLPIALYAFSRLLSHAALLASSHQPKQSLIACEERLAQLLCDANDAQKLSALHDEFVDKLRQAERSYLDMPSVFMALFDKIHRFAHQ